MMAPFFHKKAKEWYELILAGITFLFCFAPKLITLSILILLLFTVFQAVKRRMSFHFSRTALLFTLFYLAYVVGSIFTNHWDDAFKYFEYKLVFLIFPLLFSFRFNEKLQLRTISIGFIVGVIVASLLGLWHSYQVYSLHGDFNNSFGASIFSYIHHPTYFSAFLIFATFLCYQGWKSKWHYFNTWNVTLFVVFSATMHFFCFSFAGLLYFFFSGLFLFYYFIYNRFNRIIFISLVALLPLIPFVVYHSNIHIQIVLDETINDVKSYFSNPKSILTETENITGNKVRLIMWTVSTEEFLCHPLGAGTANVDDVLGKRLRHYHQNEVADQKYNPHNQFLQIAVEIGIFGLGLFLYLIGRLFVVGWKHRNFILLFLICNLVFNMLFESMLQRQSGIVFYTFWIFICLISIEQQTKKLAR